MTFQFWRSMRWSIGILMFLGIVINYMDRVNISHAIVLISKEMNLTPVEQGFIMSAFSWGYVAFFLFLKGFFFCLFLGGFFLVFGGGGGVGLKVWAKVFKILPLGQN